MSSKSFSKHDVLELEVFASRVLRTTIGNVSTGRIIAINDLNVETSDISASDIVQLIKTTKIDKITISTEPLQSAEMQPATNLNSSFRFVQLPDGAVGLTVSSAHPLSTNVIGSEVCVEGLSVVNKSNEIYDFTVGDVIVSVNDISLVGLSTSAAVNILSSTKDRNVTVLRRPGTSLSLPSHPSSGGSRGVSVTTQLAVDQYMTTLNAPTTAERQVDEVGRPSEDIARQWRTIRKNYLYGGAGHRAPVAAGKPPTVATTTAATVSRSVSDSSVTTTGAVQSLSFADVQQPPPYSYVQELSASYKSGDPTAFSETITRVRRRLQRDQHVRQLERQND